MNTIDIFCGNCGERVATVGEFERGVWECQECGSNVSYAPRPGNLRVNPIYEGPYDGEEFAPPPDGTRIMCPVCGRNLLGIWKDGTLQIRHSGKQWELLSGSILVHCHEKCGGNILVDTTRYSVAIVSSLEDAKEVMADNAPKPINYDIDITPAALRLALDRGIDVREENIVGSGKGGRIVISDIERYIENRTK